MNLPNFRELQLKNLLDAVLPSPSYKKYLPNKNYKKYAVDEDFFFRILNKFAPNTSQKVQHDL